MTASAPFHARLGDARTRLAEAWTAGRFEPSLYRMLYCLVFAINHVEPWVFAMEKRYGRLPGDLPDLAEANALAGKFETTKSEPCMLAYCWTDCASP